MCMTIISWALSRALPSSHNKYQPSRLMVYDMDSDKESYLEF